MEIQGIVHELYDTVQINDTFKKREVVIEYAENPAYPEYIKMEAIQANCSIFDNLKKGDTVNISFNIRGRAWNDPKTGKVNYFNTLQVWRINATNKTAGNTTMHQASAISNNNMAQTITPGGIHTSNNINEDEDNDLPF